MMEEIRMQKRAFDIIAEGIKNKGEERKPPKARETGITIDEAITYLENDLASGTGYLDPLTRDATQLGIEALQEIKRHRAFPGTAQVWRLPGETEG